MGQVQNSSGPHAEVPRFSALPFGSGFQTGIRTLGLISWDETNPSE